ncbi:MAG TPA: hypothetical protein VK488_14320 [Gaiellaceae bacterium]|nr:hypothetical protein [Gaiellaceae bacterium]
MKTDPTILRLRKANPHPLPATVDAADLFARITERRPDSRLRRRVTRRRRALVLAVSFGVMALLASTAYAISNWVFNSAVRPKVTKQEYRLAQHELTLPPGVSWPTLNVDPNSVTSRGAGGGHAVLISQNAWECYWVKAISRGDTAGQQRAQTELDALLANNILVAPAGAPEDWRPPNPPQVPYAVFAHDGGLEWVRKTYALAAAGHPHRLAQTCRANAPR